MGALQMILGVLVEMGYSYNSSMVFGKIFWEG